MTVPELERVGVKKRDYNGLEVYEIAKCSVPVTTTVAFKVTPEIRDAILTQSDIRLVFNGTFCIDRTHNSWKFGDEIQFVLYTRDSPIPERRANNDGYNRIENPIPLVLAGKFLEKALQKIWALPEEITEDTI